MSNHNKFIYKLDNKDCIYRTKGNKNRFEVLQYKRLEYTSENVDKLTHDIKKNLTDDLISSGFRKDFPPYYPRWKRKYFGQSVTATFVFLYFIDTDLLIANNGKYENNETHYWVKDKESHAIIDITEEQYTKEELQVIYITGKSAKYYGYEEEPTARFFHLMHKVQPSSILYETSDRFAPNSETNLTRSN
jgi:hypothetical protein